MNRTDKIAQSRKLHSKAHRRGFTAVEIAMVATVIAILALLVLPIFRERVEATRKVAVRDELASLAKVQLLIEADMNAYARLQDLDNSRSRGLDEPDRNVPIAAWNGTLEATGNFAAQGAPARIVWEANWEGPYAAYKNSRYVSDLQGYWFNGPDLGANGFIYVVGNGTGTPAFTGGIVDEPDFDRYPVDPWGQPYIFFGPGNYGGPGDFPSNGFETEYQSSLIISLGPDGVAGLESSQFSDPSQYLRSSFEANEGADGVDDILYRF